MAHPTVSVVCERDTENDVEKQENKLLDTPRSVLHGEWPGVPSEGTSPRILPDKSSRMPSDHAACQSATTKQEDLSKFQKSDVKHTHFSEDVSFAVTTNLSHVVEEEPQTTSESACKVNETSSQNARLASEEEKIRERSRKGRERSLRTRRRNQARLKLLEANCTHFSTENKILRELARSLSEEDVESAIESFKQYKILEDKKPEPHILSQSESHYSHLFSPLSVTASTVAAETDSIVLNGVDALLKSDHPLVPSAYKGLLSGNRSEDAQLRHTQHHINTPTPHGILQVASDVSNTKPEAPPVFHSVFADPDYREDGDFGLSIEELCQQAPLSIEEIFQLLAEGQNLPELPQL